MDHRHIQRIALCVWTEAAWGGYKMNSTSLSLPRLLSAATIITFWSRRAPSVFSCSSLCQSADKQPNIHSCDHSKSETWLPKTQLKKRWHLSQFPSSTYICENNVHTTWQLFFTFRQFLGYFNPMTTKFSGGLVNLVGSALQQHGQEGTREQKGAGGRATRTASTILIEIENWWSFGCLMLLKAWLLLKLGDSRN